MVKKIEDYIRYYMHCDFMVIPQHDESSEWKQARIKTLYSIGTEVEFIDYDNVGYFVFMPDIKPILRPLSSLTKEEMEECGNMIYDFSDDEELNKWKPSDFEILASEQFHWLLKRGFDLFSLIPSGLAIDSTTVSQEN